MLAGYMSQYWCKLVDKMKQLIIINHSSFAVRRIRYRVIVAITCINNTLFGALF